MSLSVMWQPNNKHICHSSCILVGHSKHSPSHIYPNPTTTHFSHTEFPNPRRATTSQHPPPPSTMAHQRTEIDNMSQGEQTHLPLTTDKKFRCHVTNSVVAPGFHIRELSGGGRWASPCFFVSVADGGGVVWSCHVVVVVAMCSGGGGGGSNGGRKWLLVSQTLHLVTPHEGHLQS